MKLFKACLTILYILFVVNNYFANFSSTNVSNKLNVELPVSSQINIDLNNTNTNVLIADLYKTLDNLNKPAKNLNDKHISVSQNDVYEKVCDFVFITIKGFLVLVVVLFILSTISNQIKYFKTKSKAKKAKKYCLYMINSFNTIHDLLYKDLSVLSESFKKERLLNELSGVKCDFDKYLSLYENILRIGRDPEYSKLLSGEYEIVIEDFTNISDNISFLISVMNEILQDSKNPDTQDLHYTGRIGEVDTSNVYGLNHLQVKSVPYSERVIENLGLDFDFSAVNSVSDADHL